MASSESGSDGADRMIESLRGAENSALEAVRKFLDTVNGAVPDVSADDSPRKRIIDSAKDDRGTCRHVERLRAKDREGRSERGGRVRKGRVIVQVLKTCVMPSQNHRHRPPCPGWGQG